MSRSARVMIHGLRRAWVLGSPAKFGIPALTPGLRPRSASGLRLTPSSKSQIGFRCPHCAFVAESKPAMKAHIKQTHNLKPYVCSACSQGFTNFSHLQHHWKEVHPELPLPPKEPYEIVQLGDITTRNTDAKTQTFAKTDYVKSIYPMRVSYNLTAPPEPASTITAQKTPISSTPKPPLIDVEKRQPSIPVHSRQSAPFDPSIDEELLKQADRIRKDLGAMNRKATQPASNAGRRRSFWESVKKQVQWLTGSDK